MVCGVIRMQFTSRDQPLLVSDWTSPNLYWAATVNLYCASVYSTVGFILFVCDLCDKHLNNIALSLFCPCNGSLFLTLLKRTAGFAITRQILWESWPKFKWEWNYRAIYLIWIIKISLSDLNSRRHMQTSFLFERPTALHRVQYDHGHRESHHHHPWRHHRHHHHHHHFVGVSPIVFRCNRAVTLTVRMKVCVCQQI